MASQNENVDTEGRGQTMSEGHHPESDGNNHNADGVEGTNELLDRIESSITGNQVRLMQTLNVFMNNIIAKLESIGINQQQSNDSRHSNPFCNNAQNFPNVPFQPRTSDAPSSSPSTSTSCRLDRWHISYDGSENISDFLFKVNRLQQSSGYTDGQMMANFQILLSTGSRPNKWFWAYLKRNPNAKFSDVKTAIKKEFGRLESDVEIYMRLLTRRQGLKESFDEFYNSVVGLNDRLKEPFDEKKIVDVIRNNARDKLGEILLAANVKSLEELRNKAREAERFLAKRSFVPKVVHEIDNAETQEAEPLEVEEVAAFSGSRKPTSTANYVCWNCEQKGHAYHFCPSRTRNLFCFLCGAKGVNTVECGKHSGNLSGNERRSGEHRSNRNVPDHSQH